MIRSRFGLDSFCPTMKHSKSSRWIGSILIVSVTGLSLFSCREPGAQYTGPYSPLQALETFKLPNGFRIELVASEPDVLDPVSLCFDEEGRLYVVEMGDYPSGPPAPSGRIRRLEDLDGDGRMDRSVVLADDLAFPTSVLAWNGGVLVSAAPDILYLADRDGDGQADVREDVLDPNREVDPRYLGYEVITTKGQVVNGVIQSETSRHVTIRNIDGSTVIPRGQIAKMRSTGVSFMPDGFELSLNGQQLSDLVEFLRKD